MMHPSHVCVPDPSCHGKCVKMRWWVAVYISLIVIASGPKHLLSIAEIDLNVISKVVGGITVIEY